MPLLLSVGRPELPCSSSEFIKECQHVASDNDMKQNSVRKIAGGSRNVGKIGGYNGHDQANTQFKFINDLHVAFVRKHFPHPTCKQLRPLSEYLIGKAEKMVFAETTAALKEDRQNKRRFQANSDAYNFLSLAAIVDVIYCMADIDEMNNTEMDHYLEKIGKCMLVR